MQTKELKKKYLEFFKQKQHKIISSASLIPEHDPTVLFTTAGMHPLVPYLIGQPHPQGKRLADVQKCIRTVDIDNVGDTSHLTFFEMLGNWSLGDYFKKEAIEWSFEFLTEILKFDPNNLHITVFKGDKDAEKDKESASVWRSLGIPEERIYFLPKEDNWWGPAGKTGPCGPCTEMFVDTGIKECSKDCKPGCNCGKYFEIWNDVFLEYNKVAEGKFEKLKQKNVDTGMGVERTIAMLQGKKTVYEIGIFTPIIEKIKELANIKIPDEKQQLSIRIIADHIRASTFILGDDLGISPSNLDQGYILRRFIRRTIRHGKLLGIEREFLTELAKIVIKLHKEEYKELEKNKSFILDELKKEDEKFRKTLENGLNKFNKPFEAFKTLSRETIKFVEVLNKGSKPTKEMMNELSEYAKRTEKIVKQLTIPTNKFNEMIKQLTIPTNKFNEMIKQLTIPTNKFNEMIKQLKGEQAFLLFQSYGFPLEMTEELAKEKNIKVDKKGFQKEFKKHQELSRVGAEKRFKGGLGDHSEETTKLHTATHLLNQALREVLKKKDIFQRGSNITSERLRFDFNFDRKVTIEEQKEVEDWVNQRIKEQLEVKREELTVEEAKKKGAQGVFEHKYGEKVFVYSIGKKSIEICGGPHVKNTKELGHFRIKKEESSAAGVRRIKAVLE